MLQITMGPGESGMGWLEWSSSVIGSTAWPIALVIVALIFRGQINKLLKRIKGAKYGEAEVLFREELDKIEAEVGELSASSEPKPDPDPVPQAPQLPAATQSGAAQHDDLSVPHPNLKPELLRLAIQQEKFNEIAKLSPNAAVLNAWRDVELEIDSLFENSGLSRADKQRHAFGTATKLYSMGIIDKGTMKIIDDLKNLRNTAAHIGDISITDAFRFETLSRQVIERLRDAGAR